MDLDYFKEINTIEKAYYLGYIYADGYIDKRNNLILQSKSTDNQIIDGFHQRVGGYLYYIEDRSDEKRIRSEMICLGIYRNQFVNNLKTHGVFNNKSKLISWPHESLHNYDLNLAFLCGFYDGDGFQSGGICSASYLFLEQCKYVFHIYNKIKIHNTIHFLHLPCEIRYLMFKTCPFSLIRKRKNINPNFYIQNKYGIIGKTFIDQSRNPLKQNNKRISKEDLEILVWEKPVSAIAKDLKISDVMIHKYCKDYNITKPPQGYWLKEHK